MANLDTVRERIYLQDMGDEITWCDDRIEETDREFIAIEKYNELKQAVGNHIHNHPNDLDCTDETLALHGYITIEKQELEEMRFRLSSWGNKLKVLQSWAHTLSEPARTQLYNILANGKPEP